MTKFPILLPKKRHITRLIVRDAHITHLHSGVNATVAHIRQTYWIPPITQCVQASRPEVRHLPQSRWTSLQSPRAAAITEDEC
ncbi:hypothetical protein DPMN_054265 [Dreissena polymorpha]|uniref:Integrase zinc-binding domain-containing protein n=1 Tax=Dreissena polymorpha TaxID=45954 RepID=A0A9D4CP59_DREPO|nr:hypothetical protein DPMN_054265 [Dreissena polymorpha]